MLVTTQWPLKHAATSPHLSGFVFYGCPESLTELPALWRRHLVEWDCDVIADVVNSWGECIVPIGIDIYRRDAPFDSGLILSYLLDYLQSILLKGLRMVALALWRWEALRDVRWLRPCTILRFVHGLRPKLRASDLNNARVTIPYPFNI